MFFLRTALLALAALTLGVHAAPLVPRATFNNRTFSATFAQCAHYALKRSSLAAVPIPGC